MGCGLSHGSHRGSSDFPHVHSPSVVPERLTVAYGEIPETPRAFFGEVLTHEVRRTPLPRTRVNKGKKKGRGNRCENPQTLGYVTITSYPRQGEGARGICPRYRRYFSKLPRTHLLGTSVNRENSQTITATARARAR